ncbi:hypothetical protein ACQPZP_26075 [Spirillospora sp. CA-142024]|uniref:hypothetical protein n=1 Tax=Spirillospora sp. CA-142024 TaxID=3240036 RepID=UPI003D8D57FD
MEGYQQSVLVRMREIAPRAPLPLPAPYDDPPAHLVEEAGQWSIMQLPKIKDLAVILGDPVGGGPSRHRFALPLWPDFWLEHTSSEEQFPFEQRVTNTAQYVVDRRFVRRSGEPMRSSDDLRPWSVLRLEAEAFFGWEPTRTPNSYYHIVPFELDGRPMKAYFVYDLLVHVEESSDRGRKALETGFPSDRCGS